MDKSQVEKIREYYRTAKLYLPKFSNWCIYKFEIYDGNSKSKVIQIKDQIRDIDTLRKHLVKRAPFSVWYSSGRFLNPSKVRGSKTKNILLFRNLVFDIDSDKPHNEEQIELAKDTVKNIIFDIKYKLGLKPEYIIFTGGKGFQIVYKFSNFDDKTILDLKLKGIDQDITLDKYRVIRLPMTIHKCGRLAVFLTEKELNKQMAYIFKKSFIYGLSDLRDRPGKPIARLMTHHLSTKVNGQATRSGQIVPALSAYYITNKVEGTKRFISLLIYDKNQGINIKQELEKLYKKYNLNLWFTFVTNSNIIAMNPYAFDKRKLEKIINSTKADISKIQFKKFNKIYFRISAEIRGNKKVNFIPKPASILNLGQVNKKFHISKPHIFILKQFGFPITLLNNLIGYEKPTVIETHKR